MQKYFKMLRDCILFDEIQDDNLLLMLDCLGGKVQHYSKNETIIAEGDPAKYIGIVLAGAVQIVRVDYYGNRSIVANIEPSQSFGESFACAGVEEMPVNIVASKDCEILLMDCKRITHSCSNACGFHSRLIFNLMKGMAQKNLNFNQKIEVTSKRTTREKLMTYLLLQAKNKNSNRFTIPYDRQELADYLEVDRSGLSAEISKMRREGILECEKNRFVLLKVGQ